MDDGKHQYLECGLCYEYFADTPEKTPRSLLCGHTFCTTCLQALAKPPKQRRAHSKTTKRRAKPQPTEGSMTITCPTCRQCTDVSDGVGACNVNYALKRMLVGASATLLEVQCEDCLDKAATIWCNDCGKGVSYCTHCSEDVHKRKIFSKHSRVPLKDRPFSEGCKEHQEKLHFFCVDCLVAVCAICKDGDYGEHGTHKTPLASSVEKDQKHKILVQRRELERVKKSLEKCNEELAKLMDDTKKNQEKTRVDIHESFRILESALQRRRAVLLEESAEHSNSALKELLQRREELALAATTLSSAIVDSGRVANLNGLYMLTAVKELEEKNASTLQKTGEIKTGHSKSIMSFSNQESELLSSIVSCGKVEYSVEPIESSEQNVPATKRSVPTPDHVWDTNKKATELAIDGNQLTKMVSDKFCRSCLAKTVYVNGRHSFEVKILHSSTKNVMIGIAPQNTEICHSDEYYVGGQTYPNSYGYWCENGTLYHNSDASSCGTAIPNMGGDVIGVAVDIDSETLQFSLNGKHFPRANINVTEPICPAVTLCTRGDRVEIIN